MVSARCTVACTSAAVAVFEGRWAARNTCGCCMHAYRLSKHQVHVLVESVYHETDVGGRPRPLSGEVVSGQALGHEDEAEVEPYLGPVRAKKHETQAEHLAPSFVDHLIQEDRLWQSSSNQVAIK